MSNFHRMAMLVAVFIGGITTDAHSISENWELFGSEGRLYSKDPNEFYLLSRRLTVWPRAVLYEGEIRMREKYDGGGYEEKRKRFSLDCDSDGVRDGNSPTLGWYENDKSIEPLRSETMTSPSKPPAPPKKDAYNLYWAVCRGIFQKFK